MCLLAAAAFCQAQFSIGGQLGMSFDKLKPEYGSDTKLFQLAVAPNVNYMFSDKMGVGLEIDFGFLKSDNYAAANITGELKATECKFVPYFRYVLCGYDKFQMYADLKVNVGTTKAKIDGEKYRKEFGMGVNVVPGVCYNINERMSVHAALNVLALGYNYAKTTDEVSDTYVKNNNFGLNINGNTPLNIGFFYTL